MKWAISFVLYLLCIVVSSSGKGFISGHADGTIVRYFFEDDGSGLSKVSLIISNDQLVLKRRSSSVDCRDLFVVTLVHHMLWCGQARLSWLVAVIKWSLFMDKMVTRI